jgi:hypothetical protein
MYLSDSLKFDTSRYPDGSYVSLHYAYARVGFDGYRTSGWFYTNFTPAKWIYPAISYVNSGSYVPGAGYFTVVDWAFANAMNLSFSPAGWGHYVAFVEVAVYNNNGNYWEYAPWTGASYRNPPYTSFDSDCWVSVARFKGPSGEG